MVRLPAAGSVKNQEAQLGVRKRSKKPAIGDTRLAKRGAVPTATKAKETAKETDEETDEDVLAGLDPSADLRDPGDAAAENPPSLQPRAEEPDSARDDELLQNDEGSDPQADEPDGDADAAAAEAAKAASEDAENERGGPSVREPPDGTPPAIARVFRRLPVSVHDGPPLEGIGATGIHIDRIWLGSKQDRRGCSGKTDDFSVDARNEVNVCFRVVHGRVEEDVDVIWELEGDLAKRRRGVTIPADHAYRSRSYLVLRREYVGDWRVRIFSVDGIELASTTFKVVD